MSYDKEIIKYAMTRILTDKRYSEQGEKWARFYLLKALDTGSLPQQCSKEQTWDGKKCEAYCDVRHLCPYNNGSING